MPHGTGNNETASSRSRRGQAPVGSRAAYIRDAKAARDANRAKHAAALAAQRQKVDAAKAFSEQQVARAQELSGRAQALKNAASANNQPSAKPSAKAKAKAKGKSRVQEDNYQPPVSPVLSSPVSSSDNELSAGLGLSDSSGSSSSPITLQPPAAVQPQQVQAPQINREHDRKLQLSLYKSLHELYTKLSRQQPASGDEPSSSNGMEHKQQLVEQMMVVIINTRIAKLEQRHPEQARAEIAALRDNTPYRRAYARHKLQRVEQRLQCGLESRQANGSAAEQRSFVECMATDQQFIVLEAVYAEQRTGAAANNTPTRIKPFGNVANQEAMLANVAHDLAALINAQQTGDRQALAAARTKFVAKYRHPDFINTDNCLDKFLQQSVTCSVVDADTPAEEIHFTIADGNISNLSAIFTCGLQVAAFTQANNTAVPVFDRTAAPRASKPKFNHSP